MIYIDPLNNTERENYKLLIGSIIPRPIAFVTTKSNEGVINGAPFSFFNIASSNPPIITIAVQRKLKKMKDTSFNIMNNKEFVVHIVNVDNVNKINETARNVEKDISEVEFANLELVESKKISVPGIKDSLIRMECVLEKIVPIGGENFDGSDLIIARVVAFHIDESVYMDGKIDPVKLKAVSRLAGHNYATIGEIFEIERPE